MNPTEVAELMRTYGTDKMVESVLKHPTLIGENNSQAERIFKKILGSRLSGQTATEITEAYLHFASLHDFNPPIGHEKTEILLSLTDCAVLGTWASKISRDRPGN
jgi:hypothetical protein